MNCENCEQHRQVQADAWAQVDEQPWVSIKTAAAALDVHPNSVYRMAQAGSLPASKIGKIWRVHSGPLRELRDRGESRDWGGADKRTFESAIAEDTLT